METSRCGGVACHRLSAHGAVGAYGHERVQDHPQQWLDDITDTVGQVFLGQPLQCAKCHDHKFDPIPTRDYYRIMAIFSTTQMVDRDLPF